jgi:hypothetical protein
MKVRLPPFYVPYGPGRHPRATVFPHLLSYGDKGDLEGSFQNFLERNSGQGEAPTMFYQERLSLAENGYHVLQVVGDEISDELIATLPVPAIYLPLPTDAPGRKLADLERYLPSYFKLGTEEIWEPGLVGCDHDFNLVSYAVMFKCECTGEKFNYEDTYRSDFNREGKYYGTLKCSRCGEVHALPEPEPS